MIKVLTLMSEVHKVRCSYVTILYEVWALFSFWHKCEEIRNESNIVLQNGFLNTFSCLLSTQQTQNIVNTGFSLEWIDSYLFNWTSMKRTLHLNDKCYLLGLDAIRTKNSKWRKGGKQKHIYFFKSKGKYLQIFNGFLKSFPRNSPKYVFQDEQRKLSMVAQTGNSTTLGIR